MSIWGRLPAVVRSQYVRSIAVLAGGTAIGQAVAIAITPILTRLYTPDEMGLLGVYLAFVALATVAITLNYHLGIVGAPSDEEAAHLSALAAALVPPIAILSGLILWSFIELNSFGFGELPTYSAPLAVLALVATGWFAVARYWLLREDEFALAAQLTALQQGGRAVSQGVLGVFGGGWSGLALGDLFGRFIGLGRAARKAAHEISETAGELRFQDLAEAGRHNRKFALLTTPGNFLNQLSGSLPVILIAQFFSLEAAGFYALVHRVLAMPVRLIGRSVADAFHTRFAAYSHGDPAAATRLFNRTAGALLVLSLPFAVILMVAGRSLFSLVFGAEWALAGTLAGAVAPWFVAQFTVSPLTRIVYVLQAQGVQFFYDAVKVVGVVAVLYLANAWDASLTSTVWALSAVNVAAYLMFYVMLIRLLGRSGRPRARDH